MNLQSAHLPGDRYRIQVRYVGDSFWVDSTEHVELFPAEWCTQLVRELNEVAQGIVYRAVLVGGAAADCVPAVVADDLVHRDVSLTVAEVAMLRMWLPLQVECLDASVADSKRWEIWRAQADAARSLLQKIS